MTRLRLGLCALLLVGLAGCSRKPTEQAEQATQQPAVSTPAPQTAAEVPPAQPEAAPAPTQAPRTPTATSGEKRPSAPRADKTATPGISAPPAQPEPQAASTVPPVTPEVRSEPVAPPVKREAVVPPAPPMPQVPKFAVLPAGTQINVRLSEPLDTGVTKVGDKFQATLDNDIEVDGEVAVPRGSAVRGSVMSAEGSGRVSGRAIMSLTLVELLVGKDTYALKTNSMTFEAESTQKGDAAKIGAGAGIGAAIGAIAGGRKGAAIGAAVGGGAGTAAVLGSKGKEVKLSTEQRLNFILRDEVKIQLR